MNDLVTKVINYVLHTPENTNYFVLVSMLEKLINSSEPNFGNVRLYIEDGNLYATYENLNINFSLDEQGNLIYTEEG